MHKKIKIAIIFIFCAAVTFGQADIITVASFNMQIFGETKISRKNTLAVLASIITKFDIVALQEVGSNASTASDEKCDSLMNTFINAINEQYDYAVYAYARGNQYAYVYRKDKLELLDMQLYSGVFSFSYTPIIGYFKTLNGNLDFILCTIHTSPLLAKSEIPGIKIAMEEYMAFYDEKDCIALGDFNSDGSYFIEGRGESLSGFSEYITGIPNSADTTVALSSNTYDRIQMTASMAEDFTTAWNVFIFSDYYDVSVCEGTKTTAGTENALSDHYPVWIELYTDQDTD